MPNPNIPPDNTLRHILFPLEHKAHDEQQKNAARVMAAFDKMEHQDNQTRLHIKSEVERKARNRL